MNTKRRTLTGRPVTLAGFLLLTSALAAPAFAQVEQVVVTAQKKTEDIQTVPIAVTAFTSEDLAAHQIVQFKDLQFSEPSITYTKTDFTSSNFQIRGVGTQVIAGDQESGVAFNIDDAYYAAAPVDSGQFYDIDRVEILRGPQSTLYGRGATGGTVNVFSKRPDLDTMAANFDASYGNYNAWEVKGMVNMPIITDELGIRIAADKLSRDGFATNIFPGTNDKHPDSRDQWSVRGSVRWQPSDATTVDFIMQHGKENDTRMRGQKQLCHSDPSGVLGCLPDALAAEAVNLNATYFNIPVSKQALGTAFYQVYATFADPNYATDAGTDPGTHNAATAYGFGVAEGLGLFNLQSQFVAPPGAVPSDPHRINSDFTPTMKGEGQSYTAIIKQKLWDWADATLVANSSWGNTKSQESYTNFPTPNFNATLLGTSLGTLQNTLDAYAAYSLVPSIYADPVNGPYAFVLNPANFPTLPVSSFTHLGVIGGAPGILKYVPNELAYDQSSGQTHQREIDFRFSTDFDGPLNAMFAFFYLNTESAGDYYVANDTLDYGQTLFGAILGPLDPPAGASPICANSTGCIFGTPYYDNRTEAATLNSRAVYGEVYYDIVPNELKLTLGGRYTEDTKKDVGRITIFNGFVPIGTMSNNAAINFLTATGQADFDPNKAGDQPFYYVRTKFDKLTGRAVLDWTPKVDFTDYTLVYASFAKGYKAGGANPGVQAGNGIGLPLTYKPEAIDAYELGTKNTLADGSLQLNGDFWYYDYKNYQISEIISNTSINTNINVKLWGTEASMQWAPDTHWAFNFGADFTHSGIGSGVTAVDPRNPGAGDPNAIVIKDGQLSTSNAQNCVYYYKGDGVYSSGNLDTDFSAMASQLPTVFFLPPGGAGAMHQLSGAGVPNVAYGSCFSGGSSSPFWGLSVNNPAGVGGLLAAFGFHTSDPSTGGSLTGEPVNLKGNHIANTPAWAFSVGAQYTADLDNGFTLVPRVDIYWHGDMWGRIFKDPADKIKAATEVNMQLTLNSPDNVWYAQAFVKNLFDKNNITGEYLTSSSSGLWTGAFYTDPRTFGLAVGARF
jgi:iron complex outermembrane recepter protein